MADKSRSTSKIKTVKPVRYLTILRRFGIVVLASLGCAGLLLYTLVHYTERQILTPDNWVAMVSVLPQQPVVVTALSGYVTAQIFSSVPISQEIQNALPPKAAFLATPLTNELQSLTNNVVKKIISSSTFQTLWASANRLAIKNLTANSRGQQPPAGGKLNDLFAVNLTGVKSAVQGALGKTGTALPALNNGKSLNLSANLKTKRQKLWAIVREDDFLNAVLPLLTAVCLVGVLTLSHTRRKTLLILAILLIILLLIELITIKTSKQEVLGQVRNNNYKDAVGYIYNVLTQDLRNIIYGWLIIWAVILVICMFTGPASWAKKFRSLIEQYIPAILRISVIWHEFRVWVKMYCYKIWLVTAIAFLIWMAFAASLNLREVLNYIFAAILVFELVFMVAFPRKSPSL